MKNVSFKVLFYLVAYPFFLFGQTPLERLVEQQWEDQFVADLTLVTDLQNGFDRSMSKHRTFIPDETILNTIRLQKPSSMTVILPGPEENLELKLVAVDLLSDNFFMETSEDHDISSILQPLTYQGTIDGVSGSMAALTITSNGLIGIVSSYEKGNVNFIKVAGKPYHISYADKNIYDPPINDCKSLETESRLDSPMPSEDPQRGDDACLSIHFDVNNDMYVAFGSSIQAVYDHVSSIFNAVQAIYSNEEINMNLSYIKIHSDFGIYGNNADLMLFNYASLIQAQGINGDLAHLLDITGDNMGGLAYVDVLCDNRRFRTGFSDINITTENYPVYSWSVNVLAHELGHNIGSPHTHACAWNGNNTQIDDCGNTAGSSFDGLGDCFMAGDDPIYPVEGGTIMSYCHLNTGIGINHSLGMGQQPGNLMRQKYNDALLSNCISDCNDLCIVLEYELPDSIVCAVEDTGTFTYLFTNVQGCDSIVHQKQRLIEVRLDNLGICEYGDQGLYYEFVESESGCDTMYSQFHFFDWNTYSDTVYVLTCDWNLPSWSFEWEINNDGCDTVNITFYQFVTQYETNTVLQVCNLEDEEIIVDTLVSQDGCDSIHNTYYWGNYFWAGDVVSCSAENLGYFYDTLSGWNGCDSVVSGIYMPATSYNSDSVCRIADYSQDIDTQVVTGYNGCDSLVLTQTVYSGFTEIVIYLPTCDPNENGLIDSFETYVTWDDCDSTLVYIKQYDPAPLELPYNGIDDDCDNSTPDDDLDNDGFVEADDCDDNNSSVNPNAVEIPDNGIDEDCDGSDLLVSTYQFSNTLISIYPNPTSSLLKLKFGNPLLFKISLTNQNGRLVYSALNQNVIDVQDYPSGVYYLVIVALKTNETHIEKVLILKD